MKALSQSKCFARALGDCAGKISREHFFSDSIYRLLAGKEDLTLEGAPWLPTDKSIRVSPSALAAKVLCVKHNNALSGLDAQALKFFSLLRHETVATRERIDGPMLERWYLKVLFGQMAALNDHWAPSREWLCVLFGQKSFPRDTGLLFPVAGAKIRGAYNGVDMQLHYCDPALRVPAGMYVRLGWMASYLGIAPGVGPSNFIFTLRPSEVSVAYPDKQKVALLPWSGHPAGFTGPIPNDPS